MGIPAHRAAVVALFPFFLMPTLALADRDISRSGVTDNISTRDVATTQNNWITAAFLWQGTQDESSELLHANTNVL